MKACITTTSFAVLVNRGPYSFLKASRGLKQRDPLCPLLFIIVMNTLSKLLEGARELELIRGVIVDKVGQQLEVTHIFFADDTLIFCQPEKSTMLNLLCVLLCFQAVFGLNINLKESELVTPRD